MMSKIISLVTGFHCRFFCFLCCVGLVFSGGDNILLGTEESVSPPFIEITRPGTQHISAFVTSFAFSPDGEKIVVADASGGVRVWDAVSGKELQGLSTPGGDFYANPANFNGSVGSVVFSPDGKKIVAGGSDRTVRIWDAESGEALRRWETEAGMIYSVAVSPDGEKIIVGGGRIRVLNIDSGRPLPGWRTHTHTHTGGILSVSVSPDGKKIVTSGSGPDFSTIIWDFESGRELRRLEWHTPVPNLASFSPDGKTIVTSAFRIIGGLDHGYFVRIWDSETGKELRKLEGHTASVRHAAFSSDGTKIVTGGNDRSVRIWEAESGKEMQKLDVPMAIVNRVGFSPDGRKVIAAMRDSYRDYVVRIWTLE